MKTPHNNEIKVVDYTTLPSDIVIHILSYYIRYPLHADTKPDYLVRQMYGCRFDCSKPILLYRNMMVDNLFLTKYGLPNRSDCHCIIMDEWIKNPEDQERYCLRLKQLDKITYVLHLHRDKVSQVKDDDSILPIYANCIEYHADSEKIGANLFTVPRNANMVLDNLRSVSIALRPKQPFFDLHHSFPMIKKLHCTQYMRIGGSRAVVNEWIAYMLRIRDKLPHLEYLSCRFEMSMIYHDCNMLMTTLSGPVIPLLKALIDGQWEPPSKMSMMNFYVKHVHASDLLQCVSQWPAQYRLSIRANEDDDVVKLISTAPLYVGIALVHQWLNNNWMCKPLGGVYHICMHHEKYVKKPRRNNAAAHQDHMMMMARISINRPPWLEFLDEHVYIRIDLDCTHQNGHTIKNCPMLIKNPIYTTTRFQSEIHVPIGSNHVSGTWHSLRAHITIRYCGKTQIILQSKLQEIYNYAPNTQS